MEAAFGEDFSKLDVRVGQAQEMRAIGAKAAATGEAVTFASAAPDRRTVAHELTHVVQHRRHGAGGAGISRPGDAAELEAESVADAVEAGQPAPSVRQPMLTPRADAQPGRDSKPGAPTSEAANSATAAKPGGAAVAPPDGAQPVSGNGAEAVSGNGAKAVSGNGPKAVSGNGAKAVSGNGAEVASGNSAEAASGNRAKAAGDHGAKAVSGNGAKAVSGNGAEAASDHGAKATGDHGAKAAGDHGAKAASDHGAQSVNGNGAEAASGNGAQPAGGEAAKLVNGASLPHASVDSAHAARADDTALQGAKPDRAKPGEGPPADAHAKRLATHAPPVVAGAAPAKPPPLAAASPRGHGAVPQASATLQAHDHALAGLHGAKLSELPAAAHRVSQHVATLHAEPITPAAPAPPTFAARATPPAKPAPTIAPAAPLTARPIAREPHAPPAGPITAGPRPRVPLADHTDPAVAQRRVQAGQTQLDSRLAQSHHTSLADHGEARLHAPVTPPPAPAMPTVRLPDNKPLAAAPPSQLPAPLRAKLDQAVAPALDRRVARLTADAQADTARTTAELTQLDAQHADARAARKAQTDARVEALRAGGSTRVAAVRTQWQTAQQATRDQTAAELHTQHAALEADVQTTVRAGEARSHALLTTGETAAGQRKTQADTRVAAIHADAEARVAAARGSTARAVARSVDGGINDPIDPDAHAQQILAAAKADADRELAAAQREMDDLLAHASEMSQSEIAQREIQIAARIQTLRVALDHRIHNALGEKFPRLDAVYTNEIDTLLTEVNHHILVTCGDLLRGDTAAATADWATGADILARRTERLDGTLADAAGLASFHDADAALAAFHITLTPTGGLGQFGDKKNPEAAVQQDILYEAMRIENALRAADRKGLLAEAGLTAPGAAFTVLFNEGKGTELTYSGNGAFPYGLSSASGTDYNGFTGDTNVGLANGRRYHIGHEFGHQLNGGLVNKRNHLANAGVTTSVVTPYDALGQDNAITLPDGTFVAGGNGSKRFVPTPEDRAGIVRDPARMEELRKKYAAQGMPMNPARQSVDTTFDLRDLPYQQHMTNEAGSTNEWFADIFVNWANGSLTDNAEGDAIDAWMNEHAQEWIALGLTPMPAP